MRIAIDIPTDMAYGGDPDWIAIQDVKTGELEEASVSMFGLTVTPDNVQEVEENFLRAWKTWLQAAAERCGAELICTSDERRADEWVRVPGESDLPREDYDELLYARYTMVSNVWAEAMRSRQALEARA